MANITSTTQVDAAVDAYYDKVVLARARPFQIHNIAAQTRNIPGKSGDIIKFRRFSNLSTATTVLTEGVTPNGKALDKTDLTVKLEQFGDFITVTDKVTYIVEDPILNDGVTILGQQMGETIDELTRDVLAGTASVDNADKGINGKYTAVLKSLLIDLEAYGESYGDKGQAERYARAA